ESASESARQTAALSTRLDSLSAELSRLSARIDELSQRVESSARQSQRVGASPAPPLRPAAPSPTISSSPPQPPSPPSPVISPPPSVTATPGTAPPSSGTPSFTENPRGATAAAPSGSSSTSGTAQEAYQSAYQDFSKGRYALAIPAFRDFVRRYPDSPLADSAQYAIGESYFSLARASASSGQADKAKQELEQSVQ